MWKSLCDILKIKAKISIAFHAKTDGQSEIVNQEMKCHLCSYVNHFQDNWVDLLLMVEFATNANTSAITKIALFMATKKYISQMSFDPVDLSANSAQEKLQNRKVRSIANDMKKVWDFVKVKSMWSQQSQADVVNKHRRDVNYDIGDMVWLFTKNIKTK